MRRLPLVAAALIVAAVGVHGVSAATTPKSVVRAWSKALNANDNAAAAKLFALNARVIQPGVDVALTSRALALAFNESLPCAGKIVRITVKGNRATATFVLGERPKHRCDAPGAKAAAVFTVQRGKIVRWQQVPVPAAPSGPTA
jgi:limonene-1,2-epoxide hydrolase